MPNIQMLNPETLAKPIAPYSNVARVKASEFLFIAGQVGMDTDGKTPADFEGQCAAGFANIGAALARQELLAQLSLIIQRLGKQPVSARPIAAAG